MQRKELHALRGRRLARIRAKLSGTAERPRLAVRRSLRHISVQVIDDTLGKTLCAAADTELSETDRKGKKKGEIAVQIGKLIGERAKKIGITKVVFDRRDKKYHGRVRSVADGAREAGLMF